MNLPNKLTVARVALIPLFLLLFYAKAIPLNYFFALLVFAAASVTDLLDGLIARKRGLVTDFGKLMDPLADKLLVMSAMLCLITEGMAHALIVTVILAREFIVTSIRLVAAGNGKVMAADKWGKFKTIFQMSWISFDLFYLCLMNNIKLTHSVAVYGLHVLHVVLIVSAFAATVLSGLNYLMQNRDLFKDA